MDGQGGDGWLSREMGGWAGNQAAKYGVGG